MHRFPGFTRRIIGLWLLASVLRLIWIVANYTDDFSRFQNGDYTLYAIGGEHFAEHHDFSNSLFLVRTPLFPLLITLLDSNTTVVLIVNALFGAAAAPLTMLLAREFSIPTSGQISAGLIVAFDPPSLIYNAFLGPESLANTWLLIAIVILVAGLSARRRIVAAGIAAGVALVLSSLARPASYLLWAPLGVWLLLFSRPKSWLIIPFMLTAAIGCGAWIAHNALVFDNPTFSTIGAYNLLYYRAASIERIAANQDIDDVYTALSTRVEERLGRGISQIDSGTRYSHYAATADVQNAMQAVALDVFIAHPLIYLATIPIGLTRILILVDNVSEWVEVILGAWNGVLLLLTVIGVIRMLRQRDTLMAGVTIIVCGYFIFGTILVQTSGIDSRAHTMLTPLFAIAATTTLGIWRSEDRPFLRKENSHEVGTI